MSLITSANAQDETATARINQRATQAGDIYAGMFHTSPDKDKLIKESLFTFASMSGCTTASEIRLFVKIGLDEAHKQSAILDEAAKE